MNRKIPSLSLVLLLVVALIPLISADAETSGSFSVDVGNPGINVICYEEWSGSTWGACINNVQTFICFDRNNCGTEDMKPANCGATQACSICGDGACNNGETCSTCSQDCGNCPSSNSGGSGGSPSGGSSGKKTTSNVTNLNSDTETTTTTESTCIENWVCGEWSNAKNGCGTRTCEEKNKCGTEYLKPKTSERCPGFFGFITGGAIIDFAQSGAGIATMAGILAAVIVIVFILARKSRKKKMKESKAE